MGKRRQRTPHRMRYKWWRRRGSPSLAEDPTRDQEDNDNHKYSSNNLDQEATSIDGEYLVIVNKDSSTEIVKRASEATSVKDVEVKTDPELSVIIKVYAKAHEKLNCSSSHSQSLSFSSSSFSSSSSSSSFSSSSSSSSSHSSSSSSSSSSTSSTSSLSYSTKK